MQALSLLALCALVLGVPMSPNVPRAGSDDGPESERFWPLADCSAEQAQRAWRPVHDVVMGGISDGVPSRTEDGVRFAGVMRVEGGGFVSFRAEPTASLEDADGIRIRVRGDGQTWKFSLPGGMRGVSWQVSFQAPLGWGEIVLPFEDFLPRFRGQLVTGSEPLDPKSAREIGFTLADKQAGEYSLEVAAIEAWRAARTDVQAGTLAARTQRSAALRTALDARATAQTFLNGVAWSERLLVVAEPLQRGSLGAPASLQLGRFASASAALAERELRVVHLCGDQEVRVAGVSLGPDAARALRERWSLPRGEWACALVGKDGGVKGRWGDLVEVAPIADQVDRMPMRSRERAERSQ